ncbi:Dihydroxy-acid/6-phosphogluconate dehydratase [Penicillium griseofulvum]|uniref:Dihydroxy-acid/6-phosphogluconate dehydratase n=1 Tax=Penicillium patulum TaxID=5078 RepID=A0A135LFX4_PENPA|nr:Dihydroxy-acid/6-phosphogluconate dehydratase [Penicillium griseofulvum]KXG47854.1 Dihydroxy-acid/6-phosphogluconate dehydratase [Penicillium griseofulvum]
MSCNTKSTCKGCSCSNNPPPNIEDCESELLALRKRTHDLEKKLANLQIRTTAPQRKLRSTRWFNDDENPGMTALYIERYLNYGLTREELMSGKPIIGIAQSGSDLVPCNRHHLELAKRTTPAALMAAATVNIPAICLNVGPMLNGYLKNDLAGSGMVVWKGREMYAAGEMNREEFMDYVARGAPSVGHCNTMGTASTMNALAEALGMALPGSAAIPAPYRERGQCAYETGERIVEMVHADRKPSDIMTRAAFENVIATNTAIGGSTNAPIHINAMAKHIGVELSLDDWDQIGFQIPLLLNMQPAGEFLGEEYFRAGGLPAIMAELLDAGKLRPDALTCNGKTVEGNVRGKHTWNRQIIRAYTEPMMKDVGFLHLKGTLFNSAIMKTCVISTAFRQRFLENPDDPNAFEGAVVVFDGPEDYHSRLDDPATPIDDRSILVMRGAGPMGYPGAAEVVNMHPPTRLLRQGITSLPCIGDGRQSGTSGSPSILNASPEAAAGGNLALLRDGDRLRVDLNKRRVDILIGEEELQRRHEDLKVRGGFSVPESQTPWQEIFRRETDQLNEGMVLRDAVKYQRIAQRWEPRHNH